VNVSVQPGDSESNYDDKAETALLEMHRDMKERRGTCPVSHTAQGWYTVTRYEDVRDVLGNPDVWSNIWGVTPAYHDEGGLLGRDAPEHTELRRLIGGQLSRRAVQAHRDAIADAANHVIDAFIDDGKTDLYAAFVLFPAKVFAHIFGLPEDQAEVLKAQADANFAESDSGDYSWREEHAEFYGRVIDDRKQTLGTEEERHDILTNLARAEAAGQMQRSDSLAMIIHLVTGGTDTTSFQVCSLLYRVLSQPGLLERIKAQPALWEFAIEEDLRLDGSAIGLFRTPNHDVVLNGVAIPKDTKVRLMYASANRDADAFERPDEFWLDRPVKELRKHVGFGYGAHRCLGQFIARLQLQVALELLVERLPGLRLDGEVEWERTLFVQGVNCLPIAWDVPSH
jgi:cytochrome P450